MLGAQEVRALGTQQTFCAAQLKVTLRVCAHLFHAWQTQASVQHPHEISRLSRISLSDLRFTGVRVGTNLKVDERERHHAVHQPRETHGRSLKVYEVTIQRLDATFRNVYTARGVQK